MSGGLPGVVPIWPAGKEPLPPGWTEDDREQMMQTKKFQGYMQMAMESCIAKTAIAGVGGESRIQLDPRNVEQLP